MSPPASSSLIFHLLLLVLLLPILQLFSLPSSSSSHIRFTPSKAVYSTSFNPRGACGYFDYGLNVNDGNVAAVGRLYRNGTGCGACYELRCTDERFCDGRHGLTVVATDHGGSGAGVDFILSAQAFGRLAKSGFKSQLMALGVADVEYRRIPCVYPGHNLVIRVMDRSIYPVYLAITFLHQGGKYDIIEVQVSRWCFKWIPMRHAYGSVWDVATAPKGPLNLRFLTVTHSGEQRWVELANIIPVGWNRGDEYDTGIQLTQLPKRGVLDAMHFRCKN